MKYREATKEFKTECSKYIMERSSQILHAIDYWAHFIIKVLLFSNAVGIIVILSFLGASASVGSMIGLKIALLFFLAGFIAVGILMGVLFYRMSLFQKNLKVDTDKYFSNEIEWEKFIKNDSARLKPSTLGGLLGWISFLFFLGGIVISLINLFIYSGH
jgi:hypothetical protein